jgi:hypothetical protein
LLTLSVVRQDHVALLVPVEKQGRRALKGNEESLAKLPNQVSLVKLALLALMELLQKLVHLVKLAQLVNLELPEPTALLASV